MSYIHAIVSGIIQGLTEFLPVSSSGHLAILHRCFGYAQPDIIFDIVLHVGSLFAVIVYFRRDIAEILTKQRGYILSVFIACLPTAAIGIFFKDVFESIFANVKLIGIMLYVTAVFLSLAHIASKSRRQDGPLKAPGPVKSFIIGIAQGIAIIPGISRSGATISCGLFLKVNKESAVRFSFLASIPAVLGALILKFPDWDVSSASLPQMGLGLFFSFLFGLGSIYAVKKAVITGKLKWFAVYCFILGTAAIAIR
ncbi:MAG: undecaprenyl-diphosphate phosphatase [Candidatus Omnitrophica bacterium]|nr:undecaprenyl-diphosphate phosphatase [Candidatus Omnitrophota bacterium]